ncbi:hypothetical protein F511_10339 [Dorcoceras hygrometricum]|uniref:Uncharacterized protein n=1 Tax=Dorcoceras hygrometricum TaxID=472368 RepID=A0A2Z7CPG0_9LAMI|nr:hypothetical protein F511_10339 [Dorcoceras hygrometricum]
MAKLLGSFLVATVFFAVIYGCLGGECPVDMEDDQCLVNDPSTCNSTCNKYAPPGFLLSAQCFKAQNHTDVYFCRCVYRCPH